jgi:phage-related protein
MAESERTTEGEIIRITEDSITLSAVPLWTWCPMPGMSTTATLAVDTVALGDGYVHRATRGLNPVRETWSLAFPFTSQSELTAMYGFLRAYAVAGFWMRLPDFVEYVFVCVDEWSWSISDRTGQDHDIVGTLSASFVRSFNPQPYPMPP